MDDFWLHLGDVDENGDDYVSREEFWKLLASPKTLKLLKQMEVDTESLINLADFVFREHKGRMRKRELRNWVLDMRCSQTSTLKDHYVTRKFLTTKLTQIVEPGFMVRP
jgi:hypothetical protein